MKFWSRRTAYLNWFLICSFAISKIELYGAWGHNSHICVDRQGRHTFRHSPACWRHFFRFFSSNWKSIPGEKHQIQHVLEFLVRIVTMTHCFRKKENLFKEGKNLKRNSANWSKTTEIGFLASWGKIGGLWDFFMIQITASSSAFLTFFVKMETLPIQRNSLEKMAPNKKGQAGGKGKNNDVKQSEVFQAFVICEDFGQVYQPLSLKTPRCLLPVANRPPLAYILDHLINHCRIQQINLCFSS